MIRNMNELFSLLVKTCHNLYHEKQILKISYSVLQCFHFTFLKKMLFKWTDLSCCYTCSFFLIEQYIIHLLSLTFAGIWCFMNQGSLSSDDILENLLMWFVWFVPMHVSCWPRSIAAKSFTHISAVRILFCCILGSVICCILGSITTIVLIKGRDELCEFSIGHQAVGWAMVTKGRATFMQLWWKI